MMKKVTAVAFFLFVAFLPLSGYAAGNDNATALPAESKASPSGSPSWFEGVWTGSWQGFKGPSMSQDGTVGIRRGNKEGVFLVEYSWGGRPFRKWIPNASRIGKNDGQEGGRGHIGFCLERQSGKRDYAHAEKIRGEQGKGPD